MVGSGNGKITCFSVRFVSPAMICILLAFFRRSAFASTEPHFTTVAPNTPVYNPSFDAVSMLVRRVAVATTPSHTNYNEHTAVMDALVDDCSGEIRENLQYHAMLVSRHILTAVAVAPPPPGSVPPLTLPRHPRCSPCARSSCSSQHHGLLVV
jgi:hypothetical protein